MAWNQKKRRKPKKVERHFLFEELDVQLIEQAAGLLGLSINAFMRQAGRFWAFRTIKRAAEIRQEIESPNRDPGREAQEAPNALDVSEASGSK